MCRIFVWRSYICACLLIFVFVCLSLEHACVSLTVFVPLSVCGIASAVVGSLLGRETQFTPCCTLSPSAEPASTFASLGFSFLLKLLELSLPPATPCLPRRTLLQHLHHWHFSFYLVNFFLVCVTLLPCPRQHLQLHWNNAFPNSREMILKNRGEITFCQMQNTLSSSFSGLLPWGRHSSRWVQFSYWPTDVTLHTIYTLPQHSTAKIKWPKPTGLTLWGQNARMKDWHGTLPIVRPWRCP